MRILDDTLAGLGSDHFGTPLPDLLSEQRGDVRFETTNTDTEDDKTNSEAAHGTGGVVHDGWD